MKIREKLQGRPMQMVFSAGVLAASLFCAAECGREAAGHVSNLRLPEQIGAVAHNVYAEAISWWRTGTQQTGGYSAETVKIPNNGEHAAQESQLLALSLGFAACGALVSVVTVKDMQGQRLQYALERTEEQRQQEIAMLESWYQADSYSAE